MKDNMKISWLVRSRGVLWMLMILLVISGISCDSKSNGGDPEPEEFQQFHIFRMRSSLMSNFWGEEMTFEARVLIPHDYDISRKYPVCYHIHGFGGDMNTRMTEATEIKEKMRDGDYPKMIYIFPTAQYVHGHHEFADSDFNGPWGRAFTEEFVPAVEDEFSPLTTADCRFVTGHSSGGWSCLWLQITYPDFFGGAWSTSPDPVDFRKFGVVNIYEEENIFYDEDGNEWPVYRDMGGVVQMTILQEVRMEQVDEPVGGQWYSFHAVFGKAGPDGYPKRLMDYNTGVIDKDVVKDWERYDISKIVRENWNTLGRKLQGKLRIFVGEMDSFYLEEAVELFDDELQKLGSDAVIIYVSSRTHFNLHNIHAVLWPNGLTERIHREMWSVFQQN